MAYALFLSWNSQLYENQVPLFRLGVKQNIDTYAHCIPNWVKDRRRDNTVADHTSSAMWHREEETRLVPHVGILIPGPLF